jgi:hypothetical protein
MLPLSVNGAGDAIAALFLFHRLQSGAQRRRWKRPLPAFSAC